MLSRGASDEHREPADQNDSYGLAEQQTISACRFSYPNLSMCIIRLPARVSPRSEYPVGFKAGRCTELAVSWCSGPAYGNRVGIARSFSHL